MAKVPPYHTDLRSTLRSLGMCITTTMIVRTGVSSFRTIVSPVPEVSASVRNARRRLVLSRRDHRLNRPCENVSPLTTAGAFCRRPPC
jgi:hypothetical protein